MTFGAYLTGPFGQSQTLYQARNEAKRGRGSRKAVKAQILKDTKTIIDRQIEAGFDFVIDPMFQFYFLFQPLIERPRIEGRTHPIEAVYEYLRHFFEYLKSPQITVGPQENWFNNNVFYRRPKIQGPLNPQTSFTEKYIHLGELPMDGTAMVVLPSPYTLLMLSDVKGYTDRKQAVANLAELVQAEAQHLVSKGVGRIQYDEPAIVVRQSLGSLKQEDLDLLRRGMEVCGHIDGATTSLHTYFGDAGPIIPDLLRLPVDCIGIDGTETRLADILMHDYSGKELALGLLDARSTSLENPKEMAEQLRTVAETTHPKKLWLTPNTGTEYRGFTHGINKLDLLKQVRQMLHE